MLKINTMKEVKKGMIMKRFFVLAGFFAFFSQTSCNSKHHTETHERFFATSPIVKDTFTTKEYVSQIRAIQHIELRALESGYLQKIYVDEGEFVKEGQLMFQLLPIKYKAEYEKSDAEANYVGIEYENAKILADSNVISPVQMALVKAKLQKAKAELSLAKVNLDFAEIRAPFSGLMDRFQVRQGSLLDDGDILTTLSDITSLWVYFNVPEAEYLGLQKKIITDGKLKVKLRMANNELFDQEGVVETIEADFDNTTGNIAFRATFPNPDRLLRHGETGNIIVNVPIKNAMLIPQKATYEILDKKYVFVIDDDNVLRSREIKTGIELKDIYTVTAGLEITDKILLEGLRKLKEGDKIEYEFQKPEEVISHLGLHAE